MTRHKYNIKEISKNKNLQTIWSCAWHLAYRPEPREWDIRKVTGDQKSTSAVPPPTQRTSAEIHVSGVRTMHQCCHEHCRQQCGPGYASENGKQGANRLWWWTRENCDQIGFGAISLNQHVTCAIASVIPICGCRTWSRNSSRSPYVNVSAPDTMNICVNLMIMKASVHLNTPPDLSHCIRVLLSSTSRLDIIGATTKSLQPCESIWKSWLIKVPYHLYCGQKHFKSIVKYSVKILPALYLLRKWNLFRYSCKLFPNHVSALQNIYKAFHVLKIC